MRSIIDLDFLVDLLHSAKDDLENVKSRGTTIMRDGGGESLQTYKPVRAYLIERAIVFSEHVLEKRNSGSLILFLGQVIKRSKR